MTSSLSLSFGLTGPTPRLGARRCLQTRAQAFGEGKPSMNIVDANLGTLRERMEQVRVQERMEKWFRSSNGWYYQSGYDCKLKRKRDLHELLQVVELAAGTFGFTILTCTLCLFLVSAAIHLGQLN
ncbi:hypothetical protein QJS04_geneDACA018415 [Acorus gramineus]|uniref:Uncharacterized protein n=1 Tax=Acorus gramineus TaxID=55184 RepID=A0AAV9AF59_ACOGR|nr:hypothetical protein QJS04_geneDACA018415 [Acorus gramineus]